MKTKKKQTRRKLKSIEHDVISLCGPKSASGVDGMFFAMSKHSKFGIKMYADWNCAENAWKSQKLAHKKGLGPAVGRMLIVKYKEAKNSRHEHTYFGYETQVVNPVRGGYSSRIWKDQNEQLLAKLRKLNMGYDFYPANCGIIKGKLVLIDFGWHSICGDGYNYEE